MSGPFLYNKSGLLTPYAFTCGYIEGHCYLSIKWESCVYFVSGFDNDNNWVRKPFRNITEARKWVRAYLNGARD